MRFPKLKSFIKDNSELSRKMSSEARSCYGLDRHRVHLEKNVIGRRTRYALLALAYARGRGYITQEPLHKNEFSSFILAEYVKDLADLSVTWQELDEWKKIMITEIPLQPAQSSMGNNI